MIHYVVFQSNQQGSIWCAVSRLAVFKYNVRSENEKEKNKFMKSAVLGIAVSVFSVVGGASAGETVFNLAKFQTAIGESATSTQPVQYATDGVVAQDSRWVSNSSDDHWLVVKLAVPMSIGSAHLYSGGSWESPVSDFVLQYCDGAGWVDIQGTSVSGNNLYDLNLSFDSPVTAQQFRLYSTDATVRVKELALYPPTADGSVVPFGTDVDLNIAKLRQYAYSSLEGVHYPRLAMDGYADDTSAWASANAAGPHDLEIHLIQTEKIRGIQLYSGHEGQAGTQIENFEVAYENNGSWVVFDGGSVSGNAEQNLNLWFNASANTKKIRFRSLDNNQAFIRELVVLPENNEAGYPLWTDVKDDAPPTERFMDYDDGYYTIESRDSGSFLSASASGSTLVSASGTWFQVLLNIGTDTYRLRSNDSGECLEVSLASTHENAAVVEGDYSSMPHQRWRLVDAGDGSHVRIVNVWSGLALDLDGTNIIQNSISGDVSQEWLFGYQTHVPKKGQVAFFHYNFMYQPNWFYSWSANAEDACEYGDYHPMQWGWLTSTTPVILRGQPEWYSRAQMTCVMGFNEPDKDDQSDIPEENAAYQMSRLERMNLPVVGPCPAQNNGSWRKAYEAIAEEEGLRCEYMALHWYAGCNGGSPQNIINVINNLYNTYGKPIWITEFAVKDWYNKGTWSRNDNYNWLAEFLWRAESIDHLKKYSIFEWGTEDNNDDPTVGDGPTMGLHVRNDKTNPGYEDLSECGLLLAGWDGDTTIRDDSAYMIHNKGRSLRLIDHPASHTVSHANILHRSVMDQFMFQSAPNGNKYIIGINDGRRLHYDGSNVGLSPEGTTGTTVEWELNEYQYGWFYIDHPSTDKRLRITSTLEINMESDTASYDALMFRFIKPAQPLNSSEVQTVPYFESFENGMGAWMQSVIDDYDWSLNSGYTPTTNTGPSEASDGATYLYAEGHDSSTADEVAMVQCTFDFSTVTSVEMSFDYHMCGPYIDYLSVDIYDGTSWTSNLWNRSGSQHATSEDAWSNAFLDLSAYAGTDALTVRFRSKKGTWHASDTAIDTIRLEIPVDAAYTQWAEAAFSNAPAGTDQSLTGNPDGDSFDNEVEWALVTNPMEADIPPVGIRIVTPDFIVTFDRRDPLVTGIDVSTAWTESLINPVWRLDGDGLTEVSDEWNGDIETVSAHLPMEGTNRFIRIQVEK